MRGQKFSDWTQTEGVWVRERGWWGGWKKIDYTEKRLSLGRPKSHKDETQIFEDWIGTPTTAMTGWAGRIVAKRETRINQQYSRSSHTRRLALLQGLLHRVANTNIQVLSGPFAFQVERSKVVWERSVASIQDSNQAEVSAVHVVRCDGKVSSGVHLSPASQFLGDEINNFAWCCLGGHLKLRRWRGGQNRTKNKQLKIAKKWQKTVTQEPFTKTKSNFYNFANVLRFCGYGKICKQVYRIPFASLSKTQKPYLPFGNS